MQDDQHIQIEVVAIFLIIVGAHMIILFIIEVNIIVLLRLPISIDY